MIFVALLNPTLFSERVSSFQDVFVENGAEALWTCLSKNFERRTCGTVAPKSANPCFKKNIKSRSGENTCALKLLAAYYYVPDDVKNAIAPILENKTRNTEELPLAVTWKRRSWN
jgi:hypothetical protein